MSTKPCLLRIKHDDSPRIGAANNNLHVVLDIDTILGLSSVLTLLDGVKSLIKFAKSHHDVYVVAYIEHWRFCDQIYSILCIVMEKLDSTLYISMCMIMLQTIPPAKTHEIGIQTWTLTSTTMFSIFMSWYWSNLISPFKSTPIHLLKHGWPKMDFTRPKFEWKINVSWLLICQFMSLRDGFPCMNLGLCSLDCICMLVAGLGERVLSYRSVRLIHPT